jgi:hypothetical protein
MNIFAMFKVLGVDINLAYQLLEVPQWPQNIAGYHASFECSFETIHFSYIVSQNGMCEAFGSNQVRNS